jgi:hypothetical protein
MQRHSILLLFVSSQPASPCCGQQLHTPAELLLAFTYGGPHSGGSLPALPLSPPLSTSRIVDLVCADLA